MAEPYESIFAAVLCSVLEEQFPKGHGSNECPVIGLPAAELRLFGEKPQKRGFVTGLAHQKRKNESAWSGMTGRQTNWLCGWMQQSIMCKILRSSNVGFGIIGKFINGKCCDLRAETDTACLSSLLASAMST